MAYKFDTIQVLLVEDNSHMSRLLRTLLGGLGIKHLKTARDGESGMTALRQEPFDMIITDLAMQPMNGIEFTRMVRMGHDSPCPTIPIIMMTGHSEKHMVEAARDAGINQFLSKPLTAQSLYSRIVATIENPRDFIRTADYFGPDRRRNNSTNYRGPERRVEEAVEV